MHSNKNISAFALAAPVFPKSEFARKKVGWPPFREQKGGAEKLRNFIPLILNIVLSLNTLNAHNAFSPFVRANGKTGELLEDGYKYETAKQVFAQLVKARGDLRRQPPTFKMTTSTRSVAWMDPDNLQIGLEEQAYDVCASFGKDSLNALAALLTHEITHYYEKHNWNLNFVQRNKKLETAQQLKTVEEGLKIETQADYLGGFLAFSAGFRVYGIMPKLLPELYNVYGLPSEIEGYPSLPDRIKMAENASELLKKLLDVFETANYLTLLEAYSDARSYYQFILRDYQSREIYNNLGICTALEALQHFGSKEIPYGLPLELDANTRLNTSFKTPDPDRIKKRRTLLQEALDFFDRATQLDKNYATAFINQSSIYFLLGENEEAAFYARKGKKLSEQQNNRKSTSDALIMLGLLAISDNDSKNGDALWNEAIALGSTLAQNNSLILHDKEEPIFVDQFPIIGKEEIDNFSLSDYLEAPELDQEINVNKKTICGSHYLAASKLLVHYFGEGERYAVFQTTNSDYGEKTLKNIKIGHSETLIQSKYQAPASVIETTTGKYLIYPSRNLLFKLNAENNLESWTVYRAKLGD